MLASVGDAPVRVAFRGSASFPALAYASVQLRLVVSLVPRRPQSNTVSTYRYATALGSDAVGSPTAYSVSAAEPRT